MKARFIILFAAMCLAAIAGAQTVMDIVARQVGNSIEVTNDLDKSADASLLFFTVNGVSFTMVKVDGGTFTMGGISGEDSDSYMDEEPPHTVTLSDYYIGQTEVTQALWKAVMGTTIHRQLNEEDSFDVFVGEGDDYPMYYVNWDECQAFVKKLNLLLSSQLGDMLFALPTEAQWEYAARGGKKSNGYMYSGSNNLSSVAWHADNSGSITHPVATKSPNELGLYDMSGNVCEWCQDWYGSYRSRSQTNPTGASSGSKRVFRGGSWDDFTRECRVSNRDSGAPSNCHSYTGLRLVVN